MKFSTLSKLAAATISLGAATLMAPAAMAGSMVPTSEGEVNVGLGYVDVSNATNIGSIAGITSITSLTDPTSGEKSRLFVDETSTANYYSADYQFDAKDVGTNGSGLWYRASNVEEKGQLESGLFQIDFAQAIASLAIDFFDVEFSKQTGIVSYVTSDGTVVDANDFIDWYEIDYDANGIAIDGQYHSRLYSDVKSIVLKIGQDTASGTGDGVLFRLSSQGGEGADVPEPGMVLGLSGLAFAAMLKGGKKRMAQ
jgi:hypothetical protein